MLLILSLTLPLLVAVVMAATITRRTGPRGRTRSILRLAAPAAALPGVALALAGDQRAHEIPWLLLGATFTMDDLARPLVLVTSLLYGAALAVVSWTPGRRSRPGGSLPTPALIVFLLLCLSGNLGTYLAADTVTFYLMFALMSFSAAGLVIHHRSAQAARATRIYLILSVISETSLLAALLLTSAAGGKMLTDAPGAVASSGQGPLIVALLFVGFGIKTGTVPLHVWLPLAHPAAPPAASAVLSGAMVKAGLIGWLRFLPEGEHLATGLTLLALSLVGAFGAVVAGVLQNDPKVILAYSTISQMGFITAVVSVGLLDPDLAPAAATAAVLYAVHHGFAKGALFLGIPVLQAFGRGVPGMVVAAGMVVAGLSLAGAPWTSGALAKYLGKEAVEDAAVPALAEAGLDVGTLLPLVATGSVVLLLRCGWVLATGEREDGVRPDAQLLAWAALVAAGVLIPWGVATYWSAVTMPTWDLPTLWDTIWPLTLGLALGLAVWWLRGRRGQSGRVPRLPPGDLVVPVEAGVGRTAVVLETTLDLAHRSTAWTAGVWVQLWSSVARSFRRLTAAFEKQLDGWERSGVALLLILTAALAALTLVGG